MPKTNVRHHRANPLSPGRAAVLASLALGCTWPTPEELATDTTTGAPGAGTTETSGASSSGNDSTPTTGEAPPNQPDPLPAYCEPLRNQVQDILATQCQGCHGEVPAGNNFSNVTDLEALVELEKIKPGDPANSLLQQRIEASEMPPPPATPLSADQKGAIAQWIGECVPVPGADPLVPPACPPEQPLTLEQMIDLIHDDVGKVNADDRPFTRYISFAHLLNEGNCAGQLKTYAQALTKLLNSLSLKNSLGFPVAIEGGAAIYRIDLRHFGWSQELWDKIACANPYSVDYKINALAPNAATIQLDVESSLFVQPGDSFMHIVSRPPLYHDILGLPETLDQLATELDVDLSADIADEEANDQGIVARGAIYDSLVSFANRMIEWHEVPGDDEAYFWLSHDFKNSEDLRDIFAHPLDFTADGGEVIFSLPNGLQAYMIVDQLGNRIDEAPLEVVKDFENANGPVINGISCMGCHARGMRVRADELREKGLTSPELFDSTETVEKILRLHPDNEASVLPNDAFLAIQSANKSRFVLTQTSADIPHVIEIGSGKFKEPISLVDLAFGENVDKNHAAADLWTTAEQLDSVKFEILDLQQLDKPAGLLRGDFEKVFSQTTEKLKIGDAHPIEACATLMVP